MGGQLDSFDAANKDLQGVRGGGGKDANYEDLPSSLKKANEKD